MKAARRDRYGPPEVVEIRDIDKPAPGEGEILVRVRAASVNRADLDALTPKPGFVRLFLGLRAPKQHHVGLDVAGVVEGVGPGVTQFKPGDRVFGDMYPTNQGAFAEYVAAREKAFQPIAPGMSFEDAATLPHSANLAMQSLRRRDGRTVQPGERVLVDGASGNVGPFAVQIAKAYGAEVTGTASTDKQDFVRSLGADHVLDYSKVDYTRTGERYDWIVDVDSHHAITSARRALRPNGQYITLGGTTAAIFAGLTVGPVISRFSDRWSGLMFWWRPFHRPDIDALKELIAAGKVRPIIDRSYPLSQVVEALKWVDDGHARGKVIVTMDEPQ